MDHLFRTTGDKADEWNRRKKKKHKRKEKGLAVKTVQGNKTLKPPAWVSFCTTLTGRKERKKK